MSSSYRGYDQMPDEVTRMLTTFGFSVMDLIDQRRIVVHTASEVHEFELKETGEWLYSVTLNWSNVQAGFGYLEVFPQRWRY